MRSFLCRSVICLLILGAISAQSPTILPEKSFLYLLEGSDLKLDCVLKSTGDETLTFYKAEVGSDSPGTKIEAGNTDGFNITLKGNVNNGTTTRTMSLLKKNVAVRDRGIYRCKKSSSNDDTSITVYVFRVNTEGGVLNETVSTPIDLTCGVELLPGTVNYTIIWRKDNNKKNILVDGDKYNTKEKGILKINKPERADMGTYHCTISFIKDGQNVTAQEIEVKAAPKIDSSDNNKNMVQGDTLELKCKVSGFPEPKVTWLKNGKVLNQTGTRIHLLKYEGSETGKLQIYDLEYSDEGDYSCVATSDMVFENDTKTMKVRVKDKLAALWPFLGIVAEVIILCIIILVYEKKRSKQMSDDDDATDGNVEKTPDNKDVRHRRT